MFRSIAATLCSLALTVTTGCAFTVGSDAAPAREDTAQTNEPLITSWTKLWPNGVVPVCFEFTGSDHDKLLTRQAVEGTWARVAKVTFTGWDVCFDGPHAGVHIRQTGGMPTTTAIGRDLDGVDGGVTMNYSFVTWGHSACSVDATAMETCIKHQAIRVMGYALGFSPNAFEDPDTVMSNSNVGQLTLSAGDVASVQAAYGVRYDLSSPITLPCRRVYTWVNGVLQAQLVCP